MRSFRERRPWLVGLVSMILISIAVTFAFSINKFPQLRGVYSLSAELEDAAGLKPGNEVRVAGVKVGNVTDVLLVDGMAQVKFELGDDIVLPTTTVVRVKLKTLLGQKFIELDVPDSFLTAASGVNDPEAQGPVLEDGDVIPVEQTRVPFEIYQAATEGTAALEGIDKRALRRMLGALADTIGTSKEEVNRFLRSLARAGDVLDDKGVEISRLLRNTEKVSATLAASGQDLEGILSNASEVLGVLADERATISSLLAATNDLTGNLAVLLETSRGDIQAAAGSLVSVVGVIEEEVDTLVLAIDELGPAQELFATPLKFGRFIEGHVCAITTEDTCVPGGEPSHPGVPVKGQQPDFTPKALVR